jgi:hypothetical protein
MHRFCRHAVRLAALACLAVCGCATYADRLADVREQYRLNDLTGAQETLAKNRHRSDKDVVELDRGILQLVSGNPKEAEKTLRAARDRFDAAEDKSVVVQKTVSMLTDANHEVYRGEDYEKVMIRAMLALTNLMNGGGDASAYALQVNDKQQQIIEAAKDKEGENPKLSYKQVALGPYLRGALREATHNNYDDVARNCTLVCSWQPEFPFAMQDLDRAKRGRHSAPGNGVLYVFTFVGVGPHKEQSIEVASTVSLLIADRILSALGNQNLPPTIAPIKVPKVVLAATDPGAVGVAVDGVPMGRTATITDVGRMAVEQYDAIYPHVIAEAVVRRVVKKAVIYGAMEATGTQKNSLQGLAFDALGVAWEASEQADTRCWGLLPEKIQVLRLELPAGPHKIGLQKVGATGYSLGTTENESILIENGRTSYMLANFPDYRLVGKILSSTP